MTSHPHAGLPLLIALALSIPMSGCSSKGDSNACIAAGSFVATPAGQVLIETIKVGDEISSIELDTGRRYAAKVIAVKSARRRCLTLTTRSGHSICATGEHPFLSPETRGFEPLSRWTSGVRRLRQVYLHDATCGPRPERVVACQEHSEVLEVFDLTVGSEDHNFIANGFVVHNKSEAAPPLDVSGEWDGSWKGHAGETGRLTAVLSSKDSKTTGTVVFFGEASETCRATGNLESRCFKASVPNSNYDGRLDGQVSAVKYTMTFGGTVKGRRITGGYRVLTGQPCMGMSGDFELARAATASDSELILPRTIWIVLEDDRVTGVAKSIHPTQRR